MRYTQPIENTRVRRSQLRDDQACPIDVMHYPLAGLCTKITSDYKQRWFVQNRTTISSARPRLLVQSPLAASKGPGPYSLRAPARCRLPPISDGWRGGGDD